MASTFSTGLRLEKQTAGDNLNTWGTILSAQIELVDRAISGETAIATTGGDTTLTTVDGDEDQQRMQILRVTGTLVSDAAIIAPTSTKTYDIFNDTAGAYTLTIKVTAGTGVLIPQGGSARVAVSSSGDVRFVGVPTPDPEASFDDNVEAYLASSAYIASIEDDISDYRADMSGNLVTGGTSTALTVTTSQVFGSLTDGLTVVVRSHVTTLAGVTFAPDGLTAKPIAAVYGTALPTGGILSGGIYTLTYDSTDDKWIASGVASQSVIGEVKDFAGATAPAFWALSYGQAISRTTYAALFEVIGTTYGVGDGSTTFNLPDLRGRVVAGQDDMGGVSADRLTNQSGGLDGDTLAATGGAETDTLTSATVPAHTHTFSETTSASGDHTHVQQVNSYDQDRGTAYGNNVSASTTSLTPKAASSSTLGGGDHTHTVSGTTSSHGSGGAHNNVQPTIILNKIIFVGA